MALKIDRRLSNIGKILGWVLVAVIVVVLAKVFIWEQTYYRDKSKEPRAKADVVVTQIETIIAPAEFEPTESEIAEYQVSASHPRYLDIPRLDIHARVRESAVNSDVLPLPNVIYDVAWFSGSSTPGNDGNILISGLAAGKTKPGVFANLDSLENGDEIIIETGAGDKYTYQVADLQIINIDEIENKLPTAQRRIDDKETLALVTVHSAGDSAKYESVVMLRATLK
jgi:LPXTG-site transpeptidase (sortase) family protein